MSTSPLSQMLLGLTAALSFGGCATASSPPLPSPPAFEFTGGQHLRIISGYLRKQPGAVVQGFVRRDPLWRGPVYGHLHVTAYAATGDVLARRTTTWTGRFADHGPPLAYHTDLDVERADVAKVTVAFAPGRHDASESFQ